MATASDQWRLNVTILWQQHPTTGNSRCTTRKHVENNETHYELSLCLSLSVFVLGYVFRRVNDLHSASPILMTVVHHVVVVRSDDALTVLGRGFEANDAVHV